MKIPIANVYYLLCYAWDYLADGERVKLGDADLEGTGELLAHLVTEGVSQLLSRGLDRGYVLERQRIRGLRGKVALSPTIATGLVGTGQLVCEYDELTYDVPHNRILRATLDRIAAGVDLPRKLRKRARDLGFRMQDVTSVRLETRLFQKVQLHRNNRRYAFLLDLCRLVLEESLVQQSTGAVRFRDFRRDEARMGELFEAFVRNYLKREQGRFAVDAPKVAWHGASGTDHALRALPEMWTGIVLSEARRSIVIDAKFYGRPLVAHRGGVPKVRSGHLYQIYSYVTNLAASWPERTVEGMLLYAAAGERFSYEYTLNGYRIRTCTLDLDQDWWAIGRDLLAVAS